MKPLDRASAVAVACGWTAVAFSALVFVLSGLVAMRPATRSDIVASGAVGAAVFLVATLGVLRVHEPQRTLRQALGLRPTAPGLLVLGLALGFVLQVPATSVRVLVEQYFPTPPEVLAAKAALLNADTLTKKMAILLAVACLGPLVEEIFFRGALFMWLRRRATIVDAVVGTSVLFTVTHFFEKRDWPSLFIVAIVLGHLRLASGSLLPCVALHVGFNATTLLALFTGVYSVSEPVELGAPVIVGGWLTAGLLVFAVQYVGAQSEEAEQARVEDEE